MFQNLVSAFHIDKVEQEVIKVVLLEQMNVFFKSKSEDSKKLKAQKTEVQKKLDAIEERFVVGGIDRSLYDKFKPKFEKEIIEIEQELNATGNYSSNLNKALKFVTKTSSNLLNMWESLSIDSKKVFQNLLFPEGIYYNHENNPVRTPRMNSFFSLIPELARYTDGHKKGISSKLTKSPLL